MPRVLRIFKSGRIYPLLLLTTLIVDFLRVTFKLFSNSLAETCRSILRRMFRNALVFTRDSYWFVVPNYREAFIAEIFCHEPRSFKFLSLIVDKLISKGKRVLFIDIGAHIGTYVIRLAKKGIDVVAVEPNPYALIYLQYNTRLSNVDNRVKILPYAVYSEKGILRLSVAPELGWSYVSDRGDISVNALTLDNICEEYAKCGSYDYIIVKIDVEGSELEVLKGAEHVLRNCRVILLCEIEPHNHKRVNSFLQRLGYRIVKLEHLNYVILRSLK